MRIFRGLFIMALLLLAAGTAWPETVHVVKSGESLHGISRRYGVSVADIVAANHLKNANSVRVGEKLVIPDAAQKTTTAETPPKTAAPVAASVPASYGVRSGDTVINLARRYGLAAGDIREWNGLNRDKIVVGQKLWLRNPTQASGTSGGATPRPAVVSNGADVPRYFFINKVKALIDQPTVQKGRWKYIVVHHSGTNEGNARIFDAAHRARGMENGLAYHFVIGNGHDSGDGEIEVGNRWLKQLQGGHLHSEELNKISIGICFVGNFNNGPPTKRQIAAGIELILYLRQICGPPYPIFKGHREINPRPTECPGNQFPLAAFHKLFD